MRIYDLKYLLAYTIPFFAILGLYLGGIWAWACPIYAFGMIPLLELVFRNSNTKYTEDEVSRRKLSPWFDLLLYLNLPIVYLVILLTLIDLSNVQYTLYPPTESVSEILGAIVSLGIVLGANGINVAHELGHRNKMFEITLARLLLLPSFYTHFTTEHNLGHHTRVATPKDPATARKGESLYAFWWRSVTGQYVSAWKIQLQLLKKKEKSIFSFENKLLWYGLLQLMYIALMIQFFGLEVALYIVAAGIIGFLLLETINYIEHYGLMRKEIGEGRYERVMPEHSWNSNHAVGRIVLYELTLHSDHHYKASKKYQILENREEAMHLPTGYPGSMLLSTIPPLWRKIMDKRVQSAEFRVQS